MRKNTNDMAQRETGKILKDAQGEIVDLKTKEYLTKGYADTLYSVAANIHAATLDTTPLDADEIGGLDSSASFALVRWTWTTLKAFLLTYFSTLFAVLAGTAGGQTLKGGTGSGNDLTLESTSHATKGRLVVVAGTNVNIGDDALATGKLNVSGDAGGATTTFNRYVASTAAPVFSFQKSRNATIGSHTVVQTNDEFGRLNWQASDGTGFIRGASIIAFSDGTPGTNDMPTRLEVLTTADGASTPTQAVRIDSSQNVKIGSGAPSARLDVLQPTLGDIVLRLQSTATNDDVIEDIVQQRVTTTDDTATAILLYTIPASTTVLIEAFVTARRTGGAAGTAEDGAVYGRAAGVKNVAGTATLIGTTNALFTMEDQTGWNCTIDVTGSTARVRVTGAISNNVTWHCVAKIRFVST